MKKTVAALMTAPVLCLGGVARADHPSHGFGPGGAGPIVTIPATSIGKGRWSAGIRTEYVKFETISDPELERLASSGEEVDSTNSLVSPSLFLGYGVTDRLSLGLHAPYVARRNIREGHLEDGTPEVHAHGDSRGFGDPTLLGHYRFTGRRDAAVDAALLLGIKLPLGETGRRDRAGDRFETGHQPGSGSWDPLIGIAATRKAAFLSVDANLLYVWATEGAQETDVGDLLHYNAALSYGWGGEGRGPAHEVGAMHDHGSHSHVTWDLVLEANGEWRRKEEVAGVKDGNSGGNLVFLSPGARMTVSDRLWVSVSFGVPVVQDLNGRQHETGYRVVAGLGGGF